MDEIVRARDPISGVGIVDGTGRGGAVPMDRVRGPKSGRDGWGVRSFTSYVHQTTCLQSIRISWFGTTESRSGALVSLAQESRAADSRSSPRGDSARSGRTDVGACPGCPRRASRAVHRGRPAALSDSPRAAVPARGAEPPHDHEEGTLPEATALTPGRAGAVLSGNAGVLALSRTVEKNQRPDKRLE